MSQTKITISDNGNITIPSEVSMTIAEIAELFGIFLQTVKERFVRLKNRVLPVVMIHHLA